MNTIKLRSKLQSELSHIYYQAYQYWRDILLIVIIVAVAGFASYQGAQLISPIIFDENTITVKWFTADTMRVFANMTDRWSDHSRIKVHPLFSLIAFPPVYVLQTALGVEPITAVRMVMAAVASLWFAALFVLLRLMSCRQFDAALFSVLAATSAAAVFWFIVPETYPFGSLSILLALGFVATTQYRKFSSLWYVAISALTLSFTVTNWMAGILATAVNHPWKRSLQITVNAFCLVVLLWGLQKRLFPSVEFFLGDREERKYILLPDSGGPLHIIKSFVAHTMVMPAIRIVDRPGNWHGILTQLSLPGSASIWGTAAVVLWTTLLGLGLWALFSVKKQLKLRVVLGLTLLGQLALHVVYGDETFLYALHFAPLLIVLAALGTLTKARLLVLVLAGTLALSAGVNNSLQLNQAIDFLHSHTPPSYQIDVPQR
jgi:hypothetical protein